MRGAEASHAWIEVMVSGHGWFGLDPTNNRVVDDTYVHFGYRQGLSRCCQVTGPIMGQDLTSLM